MLRTIVAAVGCVAGLALGGGVAQAPHATAADGCPDSRAALLAFNASRAWSIAGTKGLGVTIGVVGTPQQVGEAVCAARALAPEATVRPGAAGAIVVVADTSVDPGSVGGGALTVAAAGDTSGPMSDRPAGIVNVAAADASGAPLTTSSYGPKVTVAAYGNDTATAAGYVAALAALLKAAHSNWPARQVVAQEAGSINPVSGYPHTDRLGFGIIQPVQAVSQGAVDPAVLPGFDAMFPANPVARTGAPSASGGSSASASASATQASGSPGSSGAGSESESASGAVSGSASATTSDAASSSGPEAPSDSAQQWPTKPLPTFGTSGGVVSSASAKGGGGGGVSPVLYIGLLLLVGGGGYVLWQRRRQTAGVPEKPQADWEAPSGPRHSGYSPPEE